VSQFTPRNSPTQVRSQLTIERIEAAALTAINRFGRDRFSTSDVAELAGVSIGSVYRYFPDRVALLWKVSPVPANVVEAIGLINGALDSLDAPSERASDTLRETLLMCRALLESQDSFAEANSQH
jgi:Bacterial regulatory proteins, tetR family